MNTGIYKIINLITGDFYLGQSYDLKKRNRHHFSCLQNSKHRNRHLQNAFNKYGKENFEFKIVLYCEEFELTYYEQKLVNLWKPIYNICKECVDSRKGVPCSDESKIKISSTLKGTHLSEEHKRKISEGEKGRIISEETRRKISMANKGRPNPFSGKHYSDEARKRMSIGHKGINLGTHRSEETRKKISLGHKGIITNSKTYYDLCSPDGEHIREIKNLSKFCRERNLNIQHLWKVLNGKRKSHKGWTKFISE